tara:strand:- start:571 stop:903 length:333 start_codon:yes stop_codon:yes gene_type:complete
MANTFKSYTKASITNALTDVYTAPGATTSIIIGIAMANILDNGTTVHADVKVDKATGDDIFLIKNVALYDGAAFTFVDTGKIILETGDKLQVISDITSSVDVIVSVLEQS